MSSSSLLRPGVGLLGLMLLGSGELGKEVAIEAQRLGVEVGGTTSYDSIAAAAKLLQGGLNGNQLERVLLVSDAYHSLRIRLVAQERGLTAYVSPTRTSPVSGWSVVRLELKEAAGVSLGRLIGFDRLLHLTG